MIVAAFIEDDLDELVLNGYEYSETTFSVFAFEALAGANEVIAWSDESGNADLDAGNNLGVFPTPVNVVAGNVTSGVDIDTNEIIDRSLSPAAVPPAAKGAPWRISLAEVGETNGQASTGSRNYSWAAEAGAAMACTVGLSPRLSLRVVSCLPGCTKPFLAGCG